MYHAGHTSEFEEVEHWDLIWGSSGDLHVCVSSPLFAFSDIYGNLSISITFTFIVLRPKFKHEFSFSAAIPFRIFFLLCMTHTIIWGYFLIGWASIIFKFLRAFIILIEINFHCGWTCTDLVGTRNGGSSNGNKYGYDVKLHIFLIYSILIKNFSFILSKNKNIFSK